MNELIGLCLVAVILRAEYEDIDIDIYLLAFNKSADFYVGGKKKKKSEELLNHFKYTYMKTPTEMLKWKKRNMLPEE